MATILFPDMYIDLHTHHPVQAEGVTAIHSCLLQPGVSPSVFSSQCGALVAAGIHPRDAGGWSSDDLRILETILISPDIVFIGEAGLDKTCDVDQEQQRKVFSFQLQLAERLVKPVLIHNVRSTQELLELVSLHPRIPALVQHGFRGKPEQARQLLKKGFYLSFGVRFNPDALRACPVERLFLETDDAPADIRSVYSLAAKVLDCTEEQLKNQLMENFTRLTGNLF